MAKKVKAANPQGKGLSPVIERLTDLQLLAGAPPKHAAQIAAELFTSLFILESNIRFKPVQGRTYWLYQKKERYRLSMIAPDEWSDALSGKFIGACRLLTDLSWSLTLSEEAQNNAAFMAEIFQRRREFIQQLKTALHLEEVLPVYIGSYTFHSRVLASALAYSLGASMKKSGISRLTFDQADHYENQLDASADKEYFNSLSLGYAEKTLPTLSSTTPV